MIHMPKQIFDAKTFKDILPRAEEVRVVKSDGKTKLKLRTKSMLYTYVTDDIEAEKLLKNIDKPIVDLRKPVEEVKKEEEPRKQEEVKKEEGEKGRKGKEKKKEKEKRRNPQGNQKGRKKRRRLRSKGIVRPGRALLFLNNSIVSKTPASTTNIAIIEYRRPLRRNAAAGTIE